jgi:ParB family chromosome partitioning protein
MKRDRLGKGLGALLREHMGEEGGQQAGVSARMLPVSSIAPNPYQPRREFSETDLEDLTSSLRENGLLQPIVVRPSPDGYAVLLSAPRTVILCAPLRQRRSQVP